MKFGRSERGSVLVIVPVFFVAITMSMAAMVRQGETREFYGEQRTEVKMERVKKALAAYSHRNYRIPCPADPAVDPVTAGFGTETAGCEDNPITARNEQIGIVPFRVLGLTEFDVRDSWGNYFTYSVSPSFTRDPLVVPGVIPASHYNGAVPPVPLPMPLKTDVADNPAPYNVNTPANREAIARSFVHGACRQNGSWVEADAGWHRGQEGATYNFKTAIVSGVNFAHTLNKNNFKAQFCCSSAIPTYTYMTTEDFAQKTPCTGSEPVPTVACPVPTASAPVSWTWDNPGVAEDITFRLSVAGSAYAMPGNPWGYASSCANYTSRAPGQRRIGWRPAEHGEKGGLSNYAYYTSTSSAYVGKIANETLYMNIAGTGIKNMTAVLADLEGEEPDGKFRYSTVLIDKTTGTVIPNPNPPAACVDGVPGTVWPNVSNTLWHFESPLSTGGVTNGVGHFPITTDHFLNHPDPAVKNDFNAQLTAMGIDPDNVTMQQVHIHADYQSTLLTGLELPVPGAVDDDLIVQNEAGTSYMNPRENQGYGPADTGTFGVVSPLAAQAPAYALVSHGRNGAGAFIVGTNNRLSLADAGVDEVENADNNDNTFKYRRRVFAPGTNAHFDDVVMWDTQMSLYNALPNGTCASAQAEVN